MKITNLGISKLEANLLKFNDELLEKGKEREEEEEKKK